MITMGISVALADLPGGDCTPYRSESLHVDGTFDHDDGRCCLSGLGSIKGSFVAAYILGFTEALVVFLVPRALS